MADVKVEPDVGDGLDDLVQVIQATEAISDHAGTEYVVSSLIFYNSCGFWTMFRFDAEARVIVSNTLDDRLHRGLKVFLARFNV